LEEEAENHLDGDLEDDFEPEWGYEDAEFEVNAGFVEEIEIEIEVDDRIGRGIEREDEEDERVVSEEGQQLCETKKWMSRDFKEEKKAELAVLKNQPTMNNAKERKMVNLISEEVRNKMQKENRRWNRRNNWRDAL
jgi:restriction endonuclease